MLSVFRKYVPAPISFKEIAERLDVNGYKLGDPAFICFRPMLQVDGAFLSELVAYRLAVGEITFEQALDEPSTVIPGAKSYGQPRVDPEDKSEPMGV